MSTQVLGERGRWIAAGAGAAATAGLVVLLFAIPRIESVVPVVKPAGRPVTFADPSPTNPLVHQATTMRDLAPLFLPTPRNATLEKVPRREAAKSMLDLDTSDSPLAEKDLRIDEAWIDAGTINGVALQAVTPTDALGSAVAVGAIGFGRGDAQVAPVKPRGGVVEVVAIGSGERVWAEELPAAARPASEKPWQPLQFLASLNAAGMVGPLILTERSGAEEVDEHFRSYLSRTYRIGERLAPGIYRITVGP